MTNTPNFLSRFAGDDTGASAIEFAIIAPTLIVGMVGVLQVAMGMQSYNAVRNVTADTARFALVEYQKGETPSNSDIQTEAVNIARGAPYLLDNQSLSIRVIDAAAQRVSGATEKSITVSYTVPVVLPIFTMAAPTITHTRPIFVLS